MKHFDWRGRLNACYPFDEPRIEAYHDLAVYIMRLEDVVGKARNACHSCSSHGGIVCDVCPHGVTCIAIERLEHGDE